jgi:hypothetical protein
MVDHREISHFILVPQDVEKVRDLSTHIVFGWMFSNLVLISSQYITLRSEISVDDLV